MAMKENRSPSRSARAPLAIAIAAAAGIAVATVLALRAPSADAPAASPAVATAQLSDAPSANPFGRGEADAPQTAASNAATAPAPSSLPAPTTMPEFGTGAFRADSNGVLLLDDATRLRLDMLLSNLSKNPTQHELQVIDEEAVAGLPPAATQQALHILHTYIAYTGAQAELAAVHASGPAVKPEEVLERLATLRRRHLGTEVAQALFGKQELQERYGLQLAALDADTTLTPQQKMARIEEMQAALPEGATELRASLEASRSALSREHGVTVSRTQSGTEAQMHQ